MTETILIILFLFLIFIYFTIHKSEVVYVYSPYSRKEYLVRNLPDKIGASQMLDKIYQNIFKLTHHLIEQKEKIITLQQEDTELTSTQQEILKHSKHIDLLADRIAHVVIRESSPHSKYTSYSVNKGEEIVFCIRSKEDASLHDINTMMYVAVHELGHVGCPEIGHTPLFNQIFAFFLRHATQIGIYQYHDYAKKPIEYCGMTLNQNILS